jgi:hypothetical protein
MCQDCQPELQLYQCIDGENAFTITTAAFTMPAESGGVTIQVSDVGQFTGKWASPGQIIYISSGLLTTGYFAVVSSNSTSISVINIENTSSGNYTQNAPPGTIFPIGSKVSPAGIQGPAGPSGSSGATGSTGPAGANGQDGVAILNTLLFDEGAEVNVTGGAISAFGSPIASILIDQTKWMSSNVDGLFYEITIAATSNTAKLALAIGLAINNVNNLGGAVKVSQFGVGNGLDNSDTRRYYRIEGFISRVSATSFRASTKLFATAPAMPSLSLSDFYISRFDTEVSGALCESIADISCPTFTSGNYLIPYINTANSNDYSLVSFNVWAGKKI